jgi:hypothetical protein
MLLVGFLAVYERFAYPLRLGNNRDRRLFMCSLLFSTVEVFCCSFIVMWFTGASNKSLQHGVLFCGTQCSSARIFAAAFC